VGATVATARPRARPRVDRRGARKLGTAGELEQPARKPGFIGDVDGVAVQVGSIVEMLDALTKKGNGKVGRVVEVGKRYAGGGFSGPVTVQLPSLTKTTGKLARHSVNSAHVRVADASKLAAWERDGLAELEPGPDRLKKYITRPGKKAPKKKAPKKKVTPKKKAKKAPPKKKAVRS
jgi:hypothetical protein